MVVGGALTQYAPYPLRLNFVVLAAAIAIAIVAVLRMPHHTRDETAERWRIRPIIIPAGSRGIFVTGAVACASSFLLGAIVLPLGAKIAHQLAGSANALVTGALLSVFAVCITLNSLYARRLGEWTLVLFGAAGSIAAVWLYVLTGTWHSLAAFFAASAIAGAAYAFNFSGGLTVLSKYAAAHHRASMVSGGYLVGYLAQGIGAPLLGWVVTGHGLMNGLVTGAILFSAFFALVIASSLNVRRTAYRHLDALAAQAPAVKKPADRPGTAGASSGRDQTQPVARVQNQPQT